MTDKSRTVNDNFKPTIKQGHLAGPYHIPKQKQDEEKIKGLFSGTIIEDIDKLQDYVNSNKLSYSVSLSDGTNLIHSVLGSSDRISLEKIAKLLEFLISKGVSPGQPNSLSVYPVHIAASLQSSDLLTILIKGGASVNVYDSKKMNPLHYAAHGLIVKCKSKNKIGDLVDNDDKIQNNLIKKLIILIVEIMQSSNSIRRNINAITESFNESSVKYKNELDKITEKYLEENVAKIFANPANNVNNIDDQIDVVLEDFKNSVIRFIVNDKFEKIFQEFQTPVGYNYENSTGDTLKDYDSDLKEVNSQINETVGLIVSTARIELFNEVTNLVVGLSSIKKLFKINKKYQKFSNYINVVDTNLRNDQTNKPKTNSPIFNLIKDLQKNFDKIIAEFREINSVFAEGIENNNYKILPLIGTNKAGLFSYFLNNFIPEKNKDNSRLFNMIFNKYLRNAFMKNLIQITEFMKALDSTVRVRLNILFNNFFKNLRYIHHLKKENTILFESVDGVAETKAFTKQLQDLDSNKVELKNIIEKFIYCLRTIYLIMFNINQSVNNLVSLLNIKANILVKRNKFDATTSFEILDSTNSLREYKWIPDSEILMNPLLSEEFKEDNRGLMINNDEINEFSVVLSNFKIRNNPDDDTKKESFIDSKSYERNPLTTIIDSEKKEKLPNFSSTNENFSKNSQNIKNKLISKVVGEFNQKHKKYAKKILEKLEKNNKFDDESDEYSQTVIDYIVAQTTDKILTESFKMFAHHFAVNYVKENFTKRLTGNNSGALAKVKENNKFFIDLYRDMTESKIKTKGIFIKLDQPKKISINEILKFVIDKYQKKEISNKDLITAYHLNYTSVETQTTLTVNSSQLTEQTQFTFNINNTEFIAERKCININPDVIILLLKAGCSIHAKDSSGNLPIHYAIDSQYVKGVEILMKAKSGFMGEKYMNYRGKTPLNMALDNFTYHNSLFHDSSYAEMIKKFCRPLNLTIKRSILEKEEFANNVPWFIELILPITFIMYGQFLYDRMQKYVHSWKYQNMLDLVKMLKELNIYTKEFPNPKVPLLEFTPDELKNVLNSSDIVSAAKQQITMSVKKQREEKDDETKKNNSIEEMKKELNDVSKITELPEQYTELKNKQINEKQKESRKSKNNILKSQSIIGNLALNANKIGEMMNQKITRRIRRFDSKTLDTKLFFNRFNVIFNSIADSSKKQKETDRKNTNLNKLNFETKVDINVALIGEFDTKFYIYMWYHYLSRENKLNNLENIHLLITKSISAILTSINSSFRGTDPKLIKEKIKLHLPHINIIYNFHKNITNPLIQDYFNLPYYVSNENYVMTELYEMYKHIIRYSISASLYHVISRMIFIYVKDVSSNDETNNKETNYAQIMTDKILSTEYRGYTIKNYIIGKFTSKLVKINLKLFENDDDADVKRTTEHLKNFLINILTNNPAFPIPEESAMIQNLQNMILPYYFFLYEKFITSMRVLIENYNTYLQNEYNHIQILWSVLNN